MIIDFGLPPTYRHSVDLCFFAALELFNARAYTGPDSVPDVIRIESERRTCQWWSLQEINLYFTFFFRDLERGLKNSNSFFDIFYKMFCKFNQESSEEKDQT